MFSVLVLGVRFRISNLVLLVLGIVLVFCSNVVWMVLVKL